MFNKKNKIDKEGLNEIIYLGKNILKLLFIVLLIGIILVSIIALNNLGIFKFLGTILKVLSPLFIGFVIAWLFNPLVNKMVKKKIPRVLASIIVFVVFVIFLLLFFYIFIPVLYEQINELIKYIPSILTKANGFINKLFNKITFDGIDIDSIKSNVLEAINNFGKDFTSNFPITIVNILTKAISGVGTFLFGLIIGLYMLFDFDNISVHFLKLIPKKHQMEVAGLLDDIGTEVRKGVYGRLLVSLAVFILDTIGFSIVGLNGALLFGLFCGITDLIPYVGPYIGTAAATIVGFSQSTLTGIIVLIIAIVVQGIEGYVIQPIVISKVTNLHPVSIICGLLVFGHFFGIIGMILATPILSIFKVIWKFIVKKYNLFGENEVTTS